jgi:sulfatase maturation enzyme AslB (radical SAM superfamily)
MNIDTFFPFIKNHKAVVSRIRMFRRYKGNPRHPNIIHLAVTDSCNMDCTFCLYKKDNKNFNIMGTETAISYIRKIDGPVVLLRGVSPLYGVIFWT